MSNATALMSPKLEIFTHKLYTIIVKSSLIILHGNQFSKNYTQKNGFQSSYVFQNRKLACYSPMCLVIIYVCRSRGSTSECFCKPFFSLALFFWNHFCKIDFHKMNCFIFFVRFPAGSAAFCLEKCTDSFLALGELTLLGRFWRGGDILRGCSKGLLLYCCGL